MSKQHTEPCKECPWRKNSAPGWLGASTPEQFLAQAESETKMPCHCAIDYDKPDWKAEQLPTAPRCAGHAIYLKNRCKMPRDRELAAFVNSVEPSQLVFTRPEQFLSHHNGDPTRAMGIMLGFDDGEPR